MIKILGFILTIAGGIALVMGVLGAFGSLNVGMSPWALNNTRSSILSCWNWSFKKPKRYRSNLNNKPLGHQEVFF
ncbi:hypothetical protein [Aequorivita sinensis]|uniref:hypothetical protein n=1 Tax=Aequorivita sinensis TaxID=1382458 RepID=UPI002FE2EBC9